MGRASVEGEVNTTSILVESSAAASPRLVEIAAKFTF